MEKSSAYENLKYTTVSRRGKCDEKLVREAGIGNMLRLPGQETTWQHTSWRLEAFRKEKGYIVSARTRPDFSFLDKILTRPDPKFVDPTRNPTRPDFRKLNPN